MTLKRVEIHEREEYWHPDAPPVPEFVVVGIGSRSSSSVMPGPYHMELQPFPTLEEAQAFAQEVQETL